MSLRMTTAAIAGVFGFLVPGTSADAAFTIEIYDSGVLVDSISDGNPGDDDATAGEIEAEGVFGNFELHVHFATSNAPGGALSLLTNEVTVERIGNGGTGLLTLIVSATDYLSTLTSNILNSDVTVNDITGTGVSVTFQSWADPGNTQFETGAGTTSGGLQGPIAVLALNAVSSPFSDSNFFSLTSELNIQMDYLAETAVDTDVNVTPVPEPGTLALLAMGGVGLAGARWRRRKAT